MKTKKFCLTLLIAAAFWLTPLATPAKPLVWQGMVSFNFDDGYRNVYDNALPVFQKYGVVASFFPVVQYILDQESYAVTWQQLAECQQDGWEIGSHTMTHPDLTTLTDAQIDYELGQSQKILEQHGVNAKTLVFPYSQYNARVLDYTTRYYENSRADVGSNGFDCDRYHIVSQEVTNTTTPEQAIAWINEAVKNKKWLVLMMHQVVTGPPADYEYNVTDLEKIVAYVANNNIPAVTMQQALAIRDDSLGPNLLKNPNLDKLDKSGWAKDWTRNNAAQVTVTPPAVTRVFSSGNRLRIVGSSQQNVASTATIKLPGSGKKQGYFFSFFAEVDVGSPNAGAEIWLDEFDKKGNYIGGQWLGGLYVDTFGMPGFLYQPSSPQVGEVIIDIYSLAGCNVTFSGSNFYFGFIKPSKNCAPILNLLLQH